MNKPLPWISFGASDFINEKIRTGWKVFEYGSGASTLYWLKSGADCVSIEHNPQWYEIVKTKVSPTVALDYRLVLPEVDERVFANQESAFANPTLNLSSDENYRGYKFSDYVSQIDEFPDNSFDLVVVDGRARPSCIQHSVRKVKDGGLLLLDNADREHYLRDAKDLLKSFHCYEFAGVTPSGPWFTQTNIYVKQSP